jgi:hypothetical protein
MSNRTAQTLAWANVAWAIAFSFAWIWLRHPVEHAFGRLVTTVIEGACRLVPTISVAAIVVPWSFKRLGEIEETRDV